MEFDSGEWVAVAIVDLKAIANPTSRA
eukprot:COSAG01_NODE_73081_length_251_cov_0.677632_1_plen_26_part_01